MTAPTVLRTVLGRHPHTDPLRTGAVTGEGVRLELHEVSPIHRAFAPMVREEAYDLSELAVVTALQAVAYDRPVVLLPVVVASRFQRGCLIAHASRPVTAAGLAGRRVGVRAYTQTTGMWVRAHLAEDHGLSADRIRWITRDGAHVEQYADPSFVEHGVDERGLVGMLRDGAIDAAILGNDLPTGEEFVPVVPDAAALDRAWWERNGFVPINHVVVAGRSACRRDPAAVREAYDLLRRAAGTSGPADGEPNPVAFGFERLRRPLETTIEACLAQGLLPRRLDVDEVFDPAREVLGDRGD